MYKLKFIIIFVLYVNYIEIFGHESLWNIPSYFNAFKVYFKRMTGVKLMALSGLTFRRRNFLLNLSTLCI
jgi:hypothetical protein